MGDGTRQEYGLELCTDCYTLYDVIKLNNVLIIRYSLICTIREKRPNQYRIYISSKSMSLLRSEVTPYMTPSMLYKINNKSNPRGGLNKLIFNINKLL